MTALEWAQRKRARAQQAAYKNPESEALQRIWHYWKDIVKALHIVEDLEKEANNDARNDQI